LGDTEKRDSLYLTVLETLRYGNIVAVYLTVQEEMRYDDTVALYTGLNPGLVNSMDFGMV
jgi:hypothetical protein